MSTLLIDIGNSRIKWAVLRPQGLGRQQTLPLAGDGADAFARLAAGARGVREVVVVSVAGSARERALKAALRAAGRPSPRFMTSSREAAGLRNGYRDVWRLGADRWVAAIGAWHAAGRRRAVCVIDVGTASTVDVVDASGQHQGGLIAPGPALMVAALLKGTRGIALRAQGRARRRAGPLAADTGSAILAGALESTVALIERAARQARRTHGAATQVFLTGGGAQQLKSLIGIRFVDAPDLVLQGLAILARGPEAP
jgi:type III pantothenate kinase